MPSKKTKSEESISSSTTTAAPKTKSRKLFGVSLSSQKAKSTKSQAEAIDAPVTTFSDASSHDEFDGLTWRTAEPSPAPNPQKRSKSGPNSTPSTAKAEASTVTAPVDEEPSVYTPIWRTTQEKPAKEQRKTGRGARAGKDSGGKGSPAKPAPKAVAAKLDDSVQPEGAVEKDAGQEVDWEGYSVLFRTTSTTKPTKTSAKKLGETPRESTKARAKERGSRQQRVIEDATEYDDADPIDLSPVKPAVIVRAPAPIVEEPKKPSIAIPEDAPQVIVRSGVPTIVVDKRAYAPLFFTVGGQINQNAVAIEEIKFAVEAGIQIFGIEIPAPFTEESSQAALEQLQHSASAIWNLSPQALLFAKFKYSGKEYDAALLDDKKWAQVLKHAAEFAGKIRSFKQADQFIGCHLGSELWQIDQHSGYSRTPETVQAFRKWSRKRYANHEVTLRAAHFDGEATFDSIEVPEFSPVGFEGERFVYSSRKHRRYVDFHLFLSDQLAQRIADLAYSIKEGAEGNLMVGVSYGHSFLKNFAHSGQLALGKLLRTEEIDWISGPISYADRLPSGTGTFPLPIDSVSLNGKLFVLEEDYRTVLESKPTHSGEPLIKDPFALNEAQWRDAGAALAHNAGVEWIDKGGAGSLSSSAIWNRAKALRDALHMRMAVPTANPDLIVFLDERALAYLIAEEAFELLVAGVQSTIGSAGINAGYYLLSDLAHREHFPEAKAYVFLNAWDIRQDLRSAIKSRLQKDNKILLWLYAAGLFDGGRDSIERVREVMGIAIKPQPFYSRSGTRLVNRRHALTKAFPDISVIGGTELEPSFFAIPENSEVLGEYSETGLPSFVVRDFKEITPEEGAWTSVFLGEPILKSELARTLCISSGGHVFSFGDDVVHARPPFLTIHSRSGGDRTVPLPPKFVCYCLQTESFLTVESDSVRIQTRPGTTHTFLVGPREQVEYLLSIKLNPKSVTRVETIPPKESNTISTISMEFDVPVLALGEFIEGGMEEEFGEDWLLRPKVDDFIGLESVEDAVPARNRKRKRRTERHGGQHAFESEKNATEVRTEDDLDLDIMFRKRD